MRGKWVVVAGLVVVAAGYMRLPWAVGVALSLVFAVMFCLWRFSCETESRRMTKTESIVLDGLTRDLMLREYDDLTEAQRRAVDADIQAGREIISASSSTGALAEPPVPASTPVATSCPMCRIHREAGWSNCPVCDAVFEPAATLLSTKPEQGCLGCRIYRLLGSAECPDCGTALRRKTWQQ